MHRPLVGKVVIATHNAGKLREMRELLAPFGVEAVSAGELGLPEPDETGHMFSENAAIKAHAAATATGLPAISDDFGSLRGRARRRAGPVHGRLGGARKGFLRRHVAGGAGIAEARRWIRTAIVARISCPP